MDNGEALNQILVNVITRGLYSSDAALKDAAVGSAQAYSAGLAAFVKAENEKIPGYSFTQEANMKK